MKRWGKSPPRSARAGRHGKPHLEEDRVGGSRGPRSGPRVGRLRSPARVTLEKWSSPPSGGTRTRLTGTRLILCRSESPGGAASAAAECVTIALEDYERGDAVREVLPLLRLHAAHL